MRGRSGHNKAKPQLGRISALAGRKSRLRACRGQFGYRELLYYKDFPGMSKPVFMVSVCSSVKIKGRDCGTINGHDESSSIRALMKDAREVLVR
ncbi:hypothetical protein P834_09562 [Citrobacter freundii UCI 31]|nr:hypothetical protein P834_09562 [Citrobacter freundii UCI 31]